jgi:hypothetical protein
VKDEDYENNAGDVIENRYDDDLCDEFAERYFPNYFPHGLTPVCMYVYSDISNAFGRLTLQPISRSDLGLNFTCEARNTDLVEPKGTSISLELNRE